jgi:hypothetical protein
MEEINTVRFPTEEGNESDFQKEQLVESEWSRGQGRASVRALSDEQMEKGDLWEVFEESLEGYVVDFPVDDRDGLTNEPQPDRLLNRLDRWKGVMADGMIVRGLAPEWIGDPPTDVVQIRNVRYSGVKHVQMLLEIQKELDIGVVREICWEEARMLLKTFLIPKKNGDWRKILDCTPLNRFCRDRKFKMEDSRMVAQLLRKEMFAISIDIKSAYYHIRIDPVLSKYLCFEYDRRCFQYVGMPFGIKMAPRVFSRIMHRCIVVIRDKWKVSAVQYIDDIWIGHTDRQYLVKVSPEIVLFLRQLGRLINEEKSDLVPRMEFVFLGWKWNTVQMSVRLEERKRESLVVMVKKWMSRVKGRVEVRVKDLASLIGCLSATRLQFKVASLYLVDLNCLKTKGVKEQSWDGVIRLDWCVMHELRWWRENVVRNMATPLEFREFQAQIWTDASPSGWGACVRWKSVEESDSEILLHGHWRNGWSSNRRELAAVHMTLQRLVKIQDFRSLKSFLVWSDNTTTVYNLNRCASARSLVVPMKRLFSFLHRTQLHLRAAHIRGVENVTADSLSRLSRSGDYSLRQEYLQKALQEFGIQISCDLFVSATNYKY